MSELWKAPDANAPDGCPEAALRERLAVHEVRESHDAVASDPGRERVVLLLPLLSLHPLRHTLRIPIEETRSHRFGLSPPRQPALGPDRCSVHQLFQLPAAIPRLAAPRS